MFDCVTSYQLLLQHLLQAALSSHCIRYSNSVLPITFEMAHQIELLTPFNYHQWKDDMRVLLHTKHLFRLIEEIEEEPELDKDKAKYMNRLDEAIGLMQFSVLGIFNFTSKTWTLPRRFGTSLLPCLISMMR